jgi:hypothetical protein
MPEKVENVLPALAEADREEQARVDVELDELARKREQAKVIIVFFFFVSRCAQPPYWLTLSCFTYPMRSKKRRIDTNRKKLAKAPTTNKNGSCARKKSAKTSPPFSTLPPC